MVSLVEYRVLFPELEVKSDEEVAQRIAEKEMREEAARVAAAAAEEAKNEEIRQLEERLAVLRGEIPAEG